MENLTHYDPDVSAAEVVYEEEKHVRKVEVILSIDRADPIVASGEGDEFRAALDQVVDRLRRMLRRRRGQLKDHKGPRLVEEVTSD
jgi:ribosome-associated translation inhibitor RaiA